MALKVDVLAACREAGTEKPVDLVHLSSVTMGDRELEAEILAMFEAQIPTYQEIAKNCSTPQEVKRAAHTICGSARSIGAFELAEIAKKSEKSGIFSLEVLEAEFLRISDYIASLR